MNEVMVKDYHIALGESTDGDKILAYLVDADIFADSVTLKLEDNNIVLSDGATTHVLVDVSQDVLTTLSAHRKFKVMNVITDNILDVEVNT